MKTPYKFLFLFTCVLPYAVSSQCSIDSVFISSILIDPSGDPHRLDTNNDGMANSDDEFIEICNLSVDTVDISGWQIGDDDPPPYADYVIPDETYLPPGECIILVTNYCNPDSINLMDCDTPDGILNMGYSGTGLLGNSGDVITMANASGDMSCSVTYGNVMCSDVDPLDIPPFDINNCDYWGMDTDGCPLLPTGDSCTYIPQILPIELLEFLVYGTENQEVMLEWTTLREYNTYQYFIQWKDPDSGRFVDIGMKYSIGVSNGPAQYNFLHNTPINGQNYYRVKEVDYTGSYTFSPLRSVNIDFNSRLKLIPNIVKSGMSVNGYSDNYIISIFDIRGHLLLEKVSKRNNESLDLSHLQKGYYIARIFEGQKVINKKFLKI